MSSQREMDAPYRSQRSERQIVHSPVLPAQKARQGVTGHNARYVLGFGLAAVVIVFLVIYLVYFV